MILEIENTVTIKFKSEREAEIAYNSFEPNFLCE